MDDRPTFWRDTGASLVAVRQTEIKLHPAYNVNRLQATSQSQVRACLHSQPRTSLQRHHLLKRGYYITLHYITLRLIEQRVAVLVLLPCQYTVFGLGLYQPEPIQCRLMKLIKQRTYVRVILKKNASWTRLWV